MTAATSSLHRADVRLALETLHRDARGDVIRFLPLVPAVVWGWLRGRPFQDVVTVDAARDISMPVSRTQGELLYVLARAKGARRIVEFGTSYGVSTTYLAAAAHDVGGVVVSTEMEPGKHQRASQTLTEAGLIDVCDLRLGDARETLSEGPDEIDFLFLDGWKDLYLPLLLMLQPRLTPGALVVADNIFTFKRALRPFVEHLQSGERGYVSTTVPVGAGLECAVWMGAPTRV